MSDTNNETKFDVRLQERNLRKGLITKSDLEQHLSGLADMSEECESLDVDVELNIESPEGEAESTDAAASGPVLVSDPEPTAEQ
ncbi:MAG: hypothetical protein CMH60_04705 [Myxococcales bacterium]|nr:hypothetical protein [Myxococcales bacterium]|tara:strand:+ start:135 stop:386 length:252 start_codon:yes stop_codon:yes gene_type:complete